MSRLLCSLNNHGKNLTSRNYLAKEGDSTPRSSWLRPLPSKP
eukprot:CAMPEP_0115104182 /NCGR_PEP_ID=MMETSP0227-20121206/35126_1 /TAXON_ID=89957 /ORGANISM="Polarella glacialis, Strain CCMP 1383" /LENGTH=41 /DNA_ID= /DNA_START= /DNA_END= /DNA_ORIENTATION=